MSTYQRHRTYLFLVRLNEICIIMSFFQIGFLSVLDICNEYWPLCSGGAFIQLNRKSISALLSCPAICWLSFHCCWLVFNLWATCGPQYFCHSDASRFDQCFSEVFLSCTVGENAETSPQMPASDHFLHLVYDCLHKLFLFFWRKHFLWVYPHL